jgi:thiol-disulfide isomerase/thioredoxin
MNATVRAPEIARPATTWFNVPAPLSLADLAGRFVILDFWTFCCINCLHILPTLRRIEERFPEDVVVIGVHTPKFFAEREADNVEAAIRRYGVAHPVVHDPNMTIWREYAVRAWPTLVFVDPQGYVIGQVSGEPDPDRLVDAVADLVEQGHAQGAVSPRALDLTETTEEAGTLSFPGAIKAVPGGGWAIADTGHHQIVLTDADAMVVARFGDGMPGFEDGDAAAARFRSPQGLIADDRAVYVADTGNHALRRIDRSTGKVTTLAGTGRRGRVLGAPLPARETALASPWDVALHDGRLFFANAGSHQLGVLDLAAGTVGRLAGIGAEALVDGDATGEAVLAQPSGLALDVEARKLYFADSETSAVRFLDLDTMRVSTLVGAGLFDFGHHNGSLGDARFQHALGVAVAPEGLIVADSYNRAVRLIDLEAETVRDLEPGMLCEDAVCLRLGEPAGVAVAGPGRLLLADTNNHRILTMNTRSRSYRTWLI